MTVAKHGAQNEGVIIKTMEDAELAQFARLNQRAYPKSYLGTEEEVASVVKVFREICSDKDIVPYGAYKDGKMVGGLLYYRFSYNFHGVPITSTGIGSLAVDLLHKKEKIAKKMIEYTVNLAKEEGSPLFMLYPFKMAFYRNFGFGLGTTIYSHRTAPAHFRDFGCKHLLKEIGREELDQVFEWIDEQATRVQGMTKTTALDRRRLRNNTRASIIGAFDQTQGQMNGILIFEQSAYGTDHIGEQKIQVLDMMVSNREAMKAFSSFFNAQADQVAFIDWMTHQEALPCLLKDLYFEGGARFQSVSGHKYADASKGLMYQVLDPVRLLGFLENRLDLRWTLSFRIELLEGDAGVYKIGKGDEEIELQMSLAELSSFIVGAVSLQGLYEAGLLETNDPGRLKSLDRQLDLERPICFTRY